MGLFSIPLIFDNLLMEDDTTISLALSCMAFYLLYKQ